MNAITSTRTVIARIIPRIGIDNSYRTVQKTRFPPQRGLTHFASFRAPLRSQSVFNVVQQRRCLATSSAAGDKAPVSPHVTFYTMFGRPIAKVFLIAMGIYQALYWGWLKLEAAEEQKGKQDEIDRLEKELERVRPKAK